MNISSLILIMIILNLAIAAFCIYRCCLSRGTIEINHIALFSTGFVLYWILPIAVGALGYFRDDPGMELWYEIYDVIPGATILLYLSVCSITYLAFIAGSSFAGKYFLKPLRRSDLFTFDIKLVDVYLVPALIAATIFAVLVRHELFLGYQGSIYDDFGWRGSFVAASLPLLSLAFIYAAKLEQRCPTLPRFRKLLINRFSLSYFIVAMLVLSLGGRLHILSSLLMLLVYRTVFIRRMTVAVALTFFVTMALAAGLTGVYRMGSVITVNDMLVNLFAEFLFTSFSLIHFLGENTMELVKFPIFLLSDFINLIPTFVFPEKAEMLLQPEVYGYIIFSPGGALNSFFSFMINFGVFGTWLMLFALGFFLNFLRINGQVILFKVMYVMLSGWLAFTFFRDPFSASIVKNMFEFSIIVPAVIVVSMSFLTFIMSEPTARRYPNPSPQGTDAGCLPECAGKGPH